MGTATITQAKNGLSALIDRVRAGESVVILDRGTPVARLEPIINRGTGDDDGRLRRLERAGLVRVAVTTAPVNALLEPGPPVRTGSSAVDALIDERRSGP
jgi:prevent-host-death family protein